MDEGRNGGQEFGELKASVTGLVSSFEDFRQETRKWQDEITKRFDTSLNNHSTRLAKLEKWRTYVAGAVAALGVAWVVFRFFIEEGFLRLTGTK